VDVMQRHDKSGTPHHISNFFGFGHSTIGTIFKAGVGGGEEEAAGPHQCSHQHSLKSVLYVLEHCRRKQAQDST